MIWDQEQLMGIEEQSQMGCWTDKLHLFQIPGHILKKSVAEDMKVRGLRSLPSGYFDANHGKAAEISRGRLGVKGGGDDAMSFLGHVWTTMFQLGKFYQIPVSL